MPVRQVTLPTAEPLALTDAKNDARVSISDDDTLISNLVTTAREQVEALTSRSVVARTYELLLDGFGRSRSGVDKIELPWGPVRSITSIKYLDADGNTQTLDPIDYVLDPFSKPARLLPAPGTDWPDVLRSINVFRVRYVAGMLMPFTSDVGTDFITAPGHGYVNDDEVQIYSAGGVLSGGIANLGQYYAVTADSNKFQVAATIGGQAIDLTGAASSGAVFLGQLPKRIPQAMLLMVCHWYENRESVIVDARVAVQELPQGVESLLAPLRELSF